MSASISVDVQVAREVQSAPGDNEIASWVTSVVDRFPETAVTEVSVRIVGEGESSQLNERFRGKDGATNVLSFPADNGDFPDLPAGAPRSLGDIVVCGPVVEREAGEQQKSAADHWAHILVHGTLHLLGYDHEVSEEAEAMESMERQILAARGVADPYAT